MSTIVYQDFQSYSDSNIIETTTLKLKVPTPPTTIVENINTSNEKCWSSVQNLSSINYSKEMENSYIHRLNEHSLALCTENLGSETGTDQAIDNNIFSFSSREFKTEQSNYNKVMSYKNTQTSRKLPPLLTTLRGSNSLQCRPYREGGRLVIKAVETPQIRTYFHAERSNGRLRLCFLNDKNSVPTIDEEDGELEAENDVFEREINDDEERGEEEEEEEEENGMYMKRDMDGNNYDIEAEIGIVNCQRVSRCKEGRQGKKTFCDWRNPLWVATS